MKDIRIGAAQFEHRDNDKLYNLARIEHLTRVPPKKSIHTRCGRLRILVRRMKDAN